MAKSSNRSIPTDKNVDDFINSLSDAQQAEDSKELMKLFNRVTGKQSIMWGDAMIGYGKINLKYASGREVEWFEVGFSPRKGKITLYVTFDASELTSHFPKLGKYKTGKGCIYINKLADVDMSELEKLVARAHKTGYQNPVRADGKEQAV